ncbi:sulfotransferase 1A2-like [Amphiura filiformis]|uniref:sulfotransferase 1A2-like n=1 Tax=Amphiura filiformis TaxID=82378 RepID=UPI003B21E104
MISKLTSLPVVPRSEDEDLLHRYKGVPYIRTFPMEALECMETFEVRSDDLFLITYPKAGTTWTQEIISMVMSGANEEELIKTHLFFRFPFLEMNWASHYSQCDQVPSVYKFLHKVPSPRTIKTHLTMDHLPHQLFTKKPKVIYVARNPKDVAVSFFHMHHHFNILPYYSDFSRFLSDCMKGEEKCLISFLQISVHCGSWYEHTLSWWQKRNEPNVLFLKYEDMKQDLRKAVKQIANFLDCKMSEEAVELTVRHCSFESMKQNRSANPDYLEFFAGDSEGEKTIEPNASFIRKGTVGDWKNYFTVSQNEAFDADYKTKMEGTELTFDFQMN